MEIQKFTPEFFRYPFAYLPFQAVYAYEVGDRLLADLTQIHALLPPAEDLWDLWDLCSQVIKYIRGL